MSIAVTRNLLRRRSCAGLRGTVLVLVLLPVLSWQAVWAGWSSKSEKELVAEADAFIRDKPEPLQPFLHTLYIEGEWNAVLNFNLLALAALEIGRIDLAEKALDQSTTRIRQVYGKDTAGGPARTQWAAQSARSFLGEPYERAMTYFYRGLLYLRADDPGSARAAFHESVRQGSIGQAESYPATFALADYLEHWVASCDADMPAGDEVAVPIWKSAPDPYFQVVTSALPRHVTLFERGVAPRKVTTAESRTVLRFLPRPDLNGTVQVSYAQKPQGPPARGIAANFDWLALTRGGRPILGIADGKALFREEASATAQSSALPSPGNFYFSLSTLGADSASVARTLGMTGSRTSAGSSQPRAGKDDADTRYWASLPKLIYVEAYNHDVGLEPTGFSTSAAHKSRPPLLFATHAGRCSFAYGREFSALDAMHGGVGNPSPWPAEPLEDGRDAQNETLRKLLRSAF